MKNIILSPDVSFSAQEYAGQGNAILGIRDSGKSYSATYFAERLLDAKIPFVAFDPIGVWRFLKTPGNGAGYPIVVAGEGGDLPLTPQSAPEIVRAAMHDNIPLVIDLYSMELSKADWHKIVESCVRLLLYENKRCGLRHLFFEEAAEFCPQRVGTDQGRVYAEIEKLARMGGNASLGYTLINQRSEEVNKAVLELCDCLFLHRQKGRNSLAALEKWIHFGDSSKAKEIVRSLPGLSQGECFAWLPGADSPVFVKMPKKRTFHPDRRKPDLTDKAASSKVDVTEFVGQLQKTLPRLAEQATENDPKKLKERIRVLEKSLAASKPDPAEIERAEWRGYDRASSELVPKVNQLRSHLEKINLCVQSAVLQAPAPVESYRPRPTVPAPSAKTTSPPPARSPAFGDASSASGGVRRALVALAQRPGLTHRQLAARVGVSRKSSTFRAYLAKLRASGWLDESQGDFRLSADGVTAVGSYEPLPEGPALLNWWISSLRGHSATKILLALRDGDPSGMPKEQLAAEVGVSTTSSTWRAYLAKLRSFDLIDGSDPIRLSPDLT
jgi:hypothetical protein